MGFHVHGAEYDGADCATAGGHFNPQGVDHGAFYNDLEGRHVGDWKMINNVDGRDGVSYRYQDN